MMACPDDTFPMRAHTCRYRQTDHNNALELKVLLRFDFTQRYAMCDKYRVK
jgi:hypothetical protein